MVLVIKGQLRVQPCDLIRHLFGSLNELLACSTNEFIVGFAIFCHLQTGGLVEQKYSHGTFWNMILQGSRVLKRS